MLWPMEPHQFVKGRGTLHFPAQGKVVVPFPKTCMVYRIFEVLMLHYQYTVIGMAFSGFYSGTNLCKKEGYLLIPSACRNSH